MTEVKNKLNLRHHFVHRYHQLPKHLRLLDASLGQLPVQELGQHEAKGTKDLVH